MNKMKLLILPESIKVLMDENLLTKEDLTNFKSLSRILSKEDLVIYAVINSTKWAVRELALSRHPHIAKAMAATFEAPFQDSTFMAEEYNPISDARAIFADEVDSLKTLQRILAFMFCEQPEAYVLRYYDFVGDIIIATPQRGSSLVSARASIEELCKVLNDDFKIPVEETALFLP